MNYREFLAESKEKGR